MGSVTSAVFRSPFFPPREKKNRYPPRRVVRQPSAVHHSGCSNVTRRTALRAETFDLLPARVSVAGRVFWYAVPSSLEPLCEVQGLHSERGSMGNDAACQCLPPFPLHKKRGFFLGWR